MASDPNTYLFFTNILDEDGDDITLDAEVVISNTININSTMYATNKVSFNQNTNVFSVDGKLTANQIRNNSDVRLKKDIIPIENALERLLLIRGKEYKLKSTDETQYGFIAQDVQPVIPSIVNLENGYLNISYIELIPFLVESIKQLHTNYTLLNERIEKIDNTLSNLDNNMSSLMRKFE
jgi:hypothetical protein